MKMNLQTFGGRGSGGGKRSGEGGGGNTVPDSVRNAVEKQFPSGTYKSEEGDLYRVSYEVDGLSIEQRVDGGLFGGSIRVHPDGGSKYLATNLEGRSRYTNSLAEATKYAFGKPSDEGWRRVKG